MDREMHFRGLLIKLQDALSDSDRYRLHFLFGNIIPRKLRDDPSIAGTLTILESLFDRGKISDQDFNFLIQAFREIDRYDIVKRLEAHARQIQQNDTAPRSTLLEAVLDDDYQDDKMCTVRLPEETVVPARISTSKPNKSSGVAEPQLPIKRNRQFHRWTHFQLGLLLFNIISIIVVIIAVIFTIKYFRRQKRSLSNPPLSSGTFHICPTATWSLQGETVAGGHGNGSGLDQLNAPVRFFVDDNKTIYVADSFNHRVIKWERGERNGTIVAGGNGPGNRADQFEEPIDVVVDKNGTLYISDLYNRRVQRWFRGAKSGETIVRRTTVFGLAQDKEGILYVPDFERHIIKKWYPNRTIEDITISEQYRPHFIFVDYNQSIYLSDTHDHLVVMVEDQGKNYQLVAGSSVGNDVDQLQSPYGIVVDDLGTAYIADSGNDRIMRWSRRAKSGSLIAGGRGRGSQADQLNNPTDLTFDRDGNLYVLDKLNHRVLYFPIDNNLCL